MIYIKRTMS